MSPTWAAPESLQFQHLRATWERDESSITTTLATTPQSIMSVYFYSKWRVYAGPFADASRSVRTHVVVLDRNVVTSFHTA